MAFKVDWIPSPNYTPAASVRAIFGRGRTTEIVVGHWWGAPAAKPTYSGVVNWFKNRASQVSAHYVVGQGQMCQMVNENDAAWHARQANPFSIGIEIDPNASADTYQRVGWLVYDIRRRLGNLPLKGHSAYVATQCPGHTDLARIDRIANEYKQPPKPPPAPAPAPAPIPEWQKNLVDTKAEQLKVIVPQAFIYDLRDGKPIKPLAYATPVDFVAKTTVGGQEYYISSYSRAHALPNGLKKQDVGVITAPVPTPPPAPPVPEYGKNLADIPDLMMYAQVDTYLLDFTTGAKVTGYSRGQAFDISAKTTFAGKEYYITKYTFDNRSKVTLKGLPAADLNTSAPEEVPPAPKPDQQVDLAELTAIIKAINALWKKLLELLKIK